MKRISWSILMCSILTVALLSGCGKKEEEPAPIPEPPPEPQTKTEAVTETVTEKVKELDATVKEKAGDIKAAIMGEKVDITADLTSSLADVKAKAASLDQKSLMNYATKYKDVIAEKTAQYSGLTEKLKGLKMTDMFGEKGKALKAEVAQYKDQLTALKDRYQVYIDKLKAMGVDLSALGL